MSSDTCPLCYLVPSPVSKGSPTIYLVQEDHPNPRVLYLYYCGRCHCEFRGGQVSRWPEVPNGFLSVDPGEVPNE